MRVLPLFLSFPSHLCVSMSLGSKVMKIIKLSQFSYVEIQDGRHGTLVHPVDIDICSIDILRSLKSRCHPGGARGVQLPTRLYVATWDVCKIIVCITLIM